METLWLVFAAAAAAAVFCAVAWRRYRADPFNLATRGELEGLRAALEADPDLLRRRDAEGWNLLHIAVHEGHKEIVRFLLARGAGLAERSLSEGGGTALHIAASADSLEMVALLLRSGADPAALSTDGLSALDWARIGDAGAVIAALQDAGCPDTVDLEGVLHRAAAAGDCAALEERLRSEPGRLDRRDRETMTPLHYAAKHGKADAVRLLLDKGADARAVDMLFQSPLHFAAQGGNATVAELLLAKGADPAARDIHGNTPGDAPAGGG